MFERLVNALIPFFPRVVVGCCDSTRLLTIVSTMIMDIEVPIVVFDRVPVSKVTLTSDRSRRTGQKWH